MSRPRGILFDLDDTLYAYSPCNEAALREVHDGLGGALWPSYRAFRACHDDVRGELAVSLAGRAESHDRMRFFAGMIGRTTRASDPELAAAMYELYWQRFLAVARPAPRAHEVLGRLAADFSLALVSNHTTAPQRRKVDGLGYARYFRAVVTSEDAGAEKPDARPFRAALDALGLAPTEVVMVGDDPHTDIAGARALGIAAIRTGEFRSPASVVGEPCIAHLGELLTHPLLAAPPRG